MRLGDDDDLDEQLAAELPAGTLGALNYVLRGIERCPAARAWCSSRRGSTWASATARSAEWSAFTRVMDRANRAGVVVYTLDARGLQTDGLTARGATSPRANAELHQRATAPLPADGGQPMEQTAMTRRQGLDARS